MDGPESGNEVAYASEKQESNGLSIAAMVLGIVSVVLFCVWYVAFPCAVLAVIFGAMARSKAPEGTSGRKMATAGLVLGVISIALVVLVIAGCLAIFGAGSASVFSVMEKAAHEMQTMPTSAPAGWEGESPF